MLHFDPDLYTQETLSGDDGEINFRAWYHIPYADCQPEALGGFTTDAHDYLLAVDFPKELLAILPETKREGAIGVLSHEPRPSYQKDSNRVYGLVFAGYDIRFTVSENKLTVHEVKKG